MKSIHITDAPNAENYKNILAQNKEMMSYQDLTEAYNILKSINSVSTMNASHPCIFKNSLIPLNSECSFPNENGQSDYGHCKWDLFSSLNSALQVYRSKQTTSPINVNYFCQVNCDNIEDLNQICYLQGGKTQDIQSSGICQENPNNAGSYFCQVN